MMGMLMDFRIADIVTYSIDEYRGEKGRVAPVDKAVA